MDGRWMMRRERSVAFAPDIIAVRFVLVLVLVVPVLIGGLGP